MKGIAIAGLLLCVGSSFAVTINFDGGEVSAGSVLANQYSGLGVTFLSGKGGFAAPDTGGNGFSTTTDMTIINSNGPDTSGGGTPVGAPFSGLCLHSFNNWVNNEDGDSVFTINFTNAITAFSVDFGTILNPGSSGIYAFNDAGTLLGSKVANAQGNQTVSLTGLGAGVKHIVVTEGDFNDWVAVDNITFTQAAPEPATLAALGLGALAVIRRRKSKKA